ncbi:putative Ig domain-containing protein [Domibacillus mangrovi]|uniref:Bacterial Ig-like domain-containing protein n=1 Tax=Domibacillus mangrovi TaxID=1714354 RepID=A0A1Q5P6C2_9BACI|nr:putative Ig domain-containing protein [Domibacillus mangrovi]OKL37642.1 hypothetical protein BLL40_04905 [Domibacillus mangrovi]
MTQKYAKIVIAFLMMFVFVFSSYPAQAAVDATLEVSQVRSLGKKVTVPVILRNVTYLTSGQLEISLPADRKDVLLASFEPGDLFDGEGFRTIKAINGNKIKIDFYSQTGQEYKLMDEAVVIGYITYDLSKQFSSGQSIPLEVTNVAVKGRHNAEMKLVALNGKIEYKMPVGDVTGNNEVTAAGAIRVLQHINGDYITDREQFLSADVDVDGVLTQNDVMHILNYATGKRTTFLAVAAKEMNNAVLKSEYSEMIEAHHGRAPYQFKQKSGSMPSGLRLNEKTGELTGTPTRAGDFNFTIQVTDVIGDAAERQFSVKVIDSNIIAVEKLSPINVKRGEIPVLPKTVTVTYKDKTTGKESVVWNDVNTSVLGAVTAKGTIGASGFTINATVNVVNENYIKNVTVGYFQLLNIHTIVVDTTADVYAVTVNNMATHYEGSNQFSLASSLFKGGSYATIRLYDKYGNILETKSHKLEIN